MGWEGREKEDKELYGSVIVCSVLCRKIDSFLLHGRGPVV